MSLNIQWRWWRRNFSFLSSSFHFDGKCQCTLIAVSFVVIVRQVLVVRRATFSRRTNAENWSSSIHKIVSLDCWFVTNSCWVYDCRVSLSLIRFRVFLTVERKKTDWIEEMSTISKLLESSVFDLDEKEKASICFACLWDTCHEQETELVCHSSCLVDMIYDLTFFSHRRYNALAVCLLPITIDDRSKDFSPSSSSYYRERAIECLKRAGIDNYKVSRTRYSLSSVLYEMKEKERGRERLSSLVIKERDTRSCTRLLTHLLRLFILLI